METLKTVRVAICSFAHLHAKAYAHALTTLPGVTLSCIADDDEERGRAMAATYGTEFVNDYHDAVKRDDVDAVIVTSENARHKEMVVAAAEAGKHVLCEKPIATNVDDAKAMIAACEAAGVQLQMAFPVRFHASVVALRTMIQQGRIAKTLSIVARNPGTNPGGWFTDPALSGGGAVIDHTVHVVDVLRSIYGCEFSSVYAESGNRLKGNVSDDTGLLMLRMENGVPVSLDTSWSRPGNWPIWGGVTIDVIGEEGVLWTNAFNDNYALAETQTPSYRWKPTETTGDPEMIASFIDAVRTGRPVAVNGTDGLRAMEVALAAMESAASHQVVEIAHA